MLIGLAIAWNNYIRNPDAARRFVEMFPAAGNDAIMTQLCLPIEEAPRLLRLLAFEGIDAAAVFPGFDGVVKALGERNLWETVDDARERSMYE